MTPPGDEPTPPTAEQTVGRAAIRAGGTAGKTGGKPATEAAIEVAIEFLIEPFAPGAPGPHVEAGLAAFAERDLPVELGPFASTTTGDLDVVADAVGDAVRRSIRAGATNIRVQIAHEASALTSRNLHRALPEMLHDLEQDHGPLGQWDRATKQAAVRSLSERGAFLLRGAIEEVADAMDVSRITIYNYLNAVED